MNIPRNEISVLKRRTAWLARSRQIALGWITWPEIAVIGEAGDSRCTRAAADLRREGIITMIALSGNMKKQAKRAVEAEAEYLLFINPDGLKLRDRISGEEQPVELDAVAATVMDCLLYDWGVEDFAPERHADSRLCIRDVDLDL